MEPFVVPVQDLLTRAAPHVDIMAGLPDLGLVVTTPVGVIRDFERAQGAIEPIVHDLFEFQFLNGEGRGIRGNVRTEGRAIARLLEGIRATASHAVWTRQWGSLIHAVPDDSLDRVQLSEGRWGRLLEQLYLRRELAQEARQSPFPGSSLEPIGHYFRTSIRVSRGIVALKPLLEAAIVTSACLVFFSDLLRPANRTSQS